MEINIHSITFLITNSSTTIYTYSDNSEEQAKKLFDLMMKEFGIAHSFDELFTSVVLLNYADYYYEYFDEYETDIPEGLSKDADERCKQIKQLYKDVSNGLLPKPDWFEDVENHESWSGYTQSTKLFINAKDEKYKPIAEQLLEFLYSTSHEGCQDG